MTEISEDPAAERKHAYEHVLESLHSIYDVLIECCHEIDDVQLDAARNTRDINGILEWIHGVNSSIYKLYPEFRPPKPEPPTRRWPKERSSSDPAEALRLTRDDALLRLRHHLELARIILRESWPFAQRLGLATDGLEDHVARIEKLHESVIEEIWGDLTDERRRAWIRDWGKPERVLEPPPPDRRRVIERLNDKLETVGKTLDECAELVVELELEPKEYLRAIGTSLATIFTIQHQIYEERPDLIPLFLRDSFEVRRQDDERTAKMSEEDDD